MQVQRYAKSLTSQKTNTANELQRSKFAVYFACGSVWQARAKSIDFLNKRQHKAIIHAVLAYVFAVITPAGRYWLLAVFGTA